VSFSEIKSDVSRLCVGAGFAIDAYAYVLVEEIPLGFGIRQCRIDRVIVRSVRQTPMLREQLLQRRVRVLVLVGIPVRIRRVILHG
jgi:hypothetical protein